MIKKAILCGGGSGSRLLKNSLSSGKHLVRVFDKPMCEYPISTLKQLGITDVLVIGSKSHGTYLFQYLADGKNHDMRFYYAIQGENGGIADAVSIGETFAGGDPIMVILGDNIYDENVFTKDIKKKIKEFNNGALVFLKQVKDPERFGVANLKDGKIVKLVEKPKRPKSDLAITGLYVYDGTVFDKIRNCIPSARGEKEITTVNEMYLDENKLDHIVFEGFWSDAGTIPSIVVCDEYFRNKEDE